MANKTKGKAKATVTSETASPWFNTPISKKSLTLHKVKGKGKKFLYCLDHSADFYERQRVNRAQDVRYRELKQRGAGRKRFDWAASVRGVRGV